MAGLATPTTDPRWVRPERLTAFERYFVRRLCDERDLIFVHRARWMLLTLVPLALSVFLLPSWLVGVVALPFLAILFKGYAAPYTLMLHAVCHRTLFKKQYRGWNHVIPWMIGPFVGHTPTSFYVHHMGMHHPENNLEDDLSSTLPYQRDHFPHWVHYWFRFMVGGHVNMWRYFGCRKHGKLKRRLLLGEIAWLGAVAVLMVVNWPATLLVFVAPLLLMRTAMMTGNFTQHAFVDVDDPGNPYRNSTCLINTHYNHRCYNDGYHIVHHIKANLHWSEMAQWFDDHRDEFARQDAIVFDGVRDNQQLFVWLMTHDYDRLARHMVNWHDRSHEELVELLKSRTKRSLGAIEPLFLEKAA